MLAAAAPPGCATRVCRERTWSSRAPVGVQLALCGLCVHSGLLGCQAVLVSGSRCVAAPRVAAGLISEAPPTAAVGIVENGGIRETHGDLDVKWGDGGMLYPDASNRK